MAMSVGSSSGDTNPMVEVNTTPLIDVMLVLLVMLIITLPIQMHGVILDNPPPNPIPPETPPVVVDIAINFDGSVTWNGTPVPSTAVLEQYLRQIASEADQPELHVRPDPLVKWDYVAKVLAAAQRSGVKKIGFSGNERFLT